MSSRSCRAHRALQNEEENPSAWVTFKGWNFLDSRGLHSRQPGGLRWLAAHEASQAHWYILLRRPPTS
jgi:hypothetical protein